MRTTESLKIDKIEYFFYKEFLIYDIMKKLIRFCIEEKERLPYVIGSSY